MQRASRVMLLVVGLVGLVGPVTAGSLEPGATVTLVTRRPHIPAHPAPGQRRVSFRFASGSRARIVAVDPATGWIRVRGQRVGGGTRTGWIVARYVATPARSQAREAAADPSRLDWCPPKGSPRPRPDRLRIASWNLKNLHARTGGATYLGTHRSVTRTRADYERMRCYVRMFDPDVLAVQEVDGPEALRRVVDTDVYDVVVSRRPRSATMGGRQNTGFAYKRGLDVQRRPDVAALALRRTGLRHGTRLDVRFGGRTYRLMSVHLKSGCPDGGSIGGACDLLRAQIDVLEQWIDRAAAGPHPFVVLGDFNRRLNRPGDRLWADLDDGEPAGLDLTAATHGRPTSCRSGRFPEYVDHIVLDHRALRAADLSSFRQVPYRREDRPVWEALSDHCPIVLDMMAR